MSTDARSTHSQEEICLSVVYFVCCPGASVLQMVMEMEEREPGVMTWEGFIRTDGSPGLAAPGATSSGGDYVRM